MGIRLFSGGESTVDSMVFLSAQAQRLIWGLLYSRSGEILVVELQTDDWTGLVWLSAAYCQWLPGVRA